MTFSPESGRFIRELVKQRSGLSFSDDKDYLVESRLQSILSQFGEASVESLVARVRTSRDEKLMAAITEAMTINETSSFRDGKPFDLLKQQLLPALMQSSERQIRIWCAAASTGQEPYSVALVLKEMEGLLNSKGKTVEIVATDIDTTVLAKASLGIYTQFEVQRGLPITHLMKYFSQIPPANDRWQVKEEVKKLIHFKQHNLLENPLMLGKFDLILCRNVLIYFEPEVKKKVLQHLTSTLKPQGFLMVGASETLLDNNLPLEAVPDGRGAYKYR